MILSVFLGQHKFDFGTNAHLRNLSTHLWQGGVMNFFSGKKLSGDRTHQEDRRCIKCAAIPRMVHQMLEPRTGKRSGCLNADAVSERGTSKVASEATLPMPYQSPRPFPSSNVNQTPQPRRDPLPLGSRTVTVICWSVIVSAIGSACTRRRPWHPKIARRRFLVRRARGVPSVRGPARRASVSARPARARRSGGGPAASGSSSGAAASTSPLR